MQETVLRIRGLSKSFDKTTTLRMIAGLLQPDGGSIEVYGIDALADPRGAKRMIAWLPDEPMLYDKLTAAEYLSFVAGLWGLDAAESARRAQALLERLDVQPPTECARCRACARRADRRLAHVRPRKMLAPVPGL